MSQFIKDRQYKVERRIDVKTDYMKYIQGETETLVAVCVNVTDQYAKFSIEGKEDIKRMKWSGKDGVERVNYLKRTGQDLSDCISAGNDIIKAEKETTKLLDGMTQRRINVKGKGQQKQNQGSTNNPHHIT